MFSYFSNTLFIVIEYIIWTPSPPPLPNPTALSLMIFDITQISGLKYPENFVLSSCPNLYLTSTVQSYRFSGTSLHFWPFHLIAKLNNSPAFVVSNYNSVCVSEHVGSGPLSVHLSYFPCKFSWLSMMTAFLPYSNTVVLS